VTDLAFSSLALRSDFINTVADRMWHAWWRDAGEPLSALLGHLREFRNDAVPLGIVAHRGDDFVGSALLIDSDLEERPHYSPWLAALWVEPEARSQGVATALADRILAEAAALAHDRVYLCAGADKDGYYAARGWEEVERDVGPHRLTVFVKPTGAAARG
jgi:predicted N-acetyltransferase YhbS